MEQHKQEIKEWAKATVQAKIQELEAIKRFILRNQKAEAFFDWDELAKTEPLTDREQGGMGIELTTWDNKPAQPVLFIDWDEVNVFDNQQELFEEMFDGDFSSDKMITITGVKL